MSTELWVVEYLGIALLERVGFVVPHRVIRRQSQNGLKEYPFKLVLRVASGTHYPVTTTWWRSGQEYLAPTV